jgi:hypothetical protein
MRDTQTVPAPEAYFGFEAALKWLKAGQKVRRRPWFDDYLQVIEGEIKLVEDGVVTRCPSLSFISIIANDWEVVR